MLEQTRILYIPLPLYPPKGYQKHHRYSSETPKFSKNDLAMRNTVDETGGKPIAPDRSPEICKCNNGAI
jgi:hypothetical protein